MNDKYILSTNSRPGAASLRDQLTITSAASLSLAKQSHFLQFFLGILKLYFEI